MLICLTAGWPGTAGPCLPLEALSSSPSRRPHLPGLLRTSTDLILCGLLWAALLCSVCWCSCALFVVCQMKTLKHVSGIIYKNR